MSKLSENSTNLPVVVDGEHIVDSVIDFNKKVLGIHQRDIAMLDDNEASITHKCLIEEAEEFISACEQGNLIGSVDGLIDSIYFAIGALYKLGLTSKQIKLCMSAVHNANIDKKLGTNKKRDTGAADAVKPKGWVGPEERIATILGDTWR